jgi:hypothetical protein
VKRNFLLDENVAVRGLLQQRARDLWLTIARNCHRIAVSPLLARKYREKLRQARRRAAPEVATGMIAIVNQMLLDPEKSIWVEPGGSSPLARLIRDPDDHFLADIAAELVAAHKVNECIFVTTDSRTRQDFNRPRMRSAGIEGVTIERGLALAGTRDG